jgi:hypothetical protein
MENKVEVIRDEIQKAFPDARIEYREKKFELHKFRIDREGRPSCWLYLTWKYIEDHGDKEVLDILRRWNVFEILNNAPKSKWLAVDDFGVHEVNDCYGRGYRL